MTPEKGLAGEKPGAGLRPRQPPAVVLPAAPRFPARALGRELVGVPVAQLPGARVTTTSGLPVLSQEQSSGDPSRGAGRGNPVVLMASVGVVHAAVPDPPGTRARAPANI